MAHNFLAKVGFLTLILGAIASGSFLNACSTPTQNQALSSPSAANAEAPKPMDHSGMNHSSMELGPADAEFDLRFIDAMIPHHQGAVEMAKAAQQKSQRPEILKLATDIIQAQDKEINQMQQWRKAWYPKASKAPIAFNAQMGHSMPMNPTQRANMMMSMDLGAADQQFDLRFLNAMIPHHEGALVMAQDALAKSQRPEIRRLAQAILASQKAEIQQMQQWKKAW
jgi:uncharacterized protein (DUF305 family)